MRPSSRSATVLGISPRKSQSKLHEYQTGERNSKVPEE
jgi:hypothetical protein